MITSLESPKNSSESREDEDGFVLPTTALLLIPLLVFAAFAVDVGGWYARGGQTQRAADAAALAAVVYMPDMAAAVTAAKNEAARNGFIDQPGCDGTVCTNPTAYPQVVVTALTTQSVRVNILTEGELYFGSVVLNDPIEIERYASSEYILPVPMGNPSSALGTANMGGEGFYLALNAYCSARRQGDIISAQYFGTGWNSCPPGPPSTNPTYDADGYLFVIDFPPGTSGTSWDIEFFDPGICQGNGGSLENFGNPIAGPAIETTLWSADDTAFNDSDNLLDPPYGTHTFSENDCAAVQNVWFPAYTNVVPGADVGRWLLQVRSPADVTDLYVNHFSMRVVPSGTNTVCTAIGGSNTCPTLFARDWLPVQILNTDKWGSPLNPAGAANFYLAEIDTVHRGKTLEVTLFDPGEGMADIQIIDPLGNRYPFTWRDIDFSVLNHPDLTAADDRTGTNDSGAPTCNGGFNCLDVRSSKFQDETVRVSIDIPPGYNCNGVDCWWHIQYTPDGGTVTDRTTWQVRVIGDPVHLTE